MIGKLFLVSASSGAGKTSLVHALLARLVPLYTVERAVTYTTRSPRPEEIHGQDYHFISRQEFEKKIREDFFLEWSTMYGDYYGSPSTLCDALSTGISYFLILDQVGVKSVITRIPHAVPICILVTSNTLLLERLLKRDTETPAVLHKRLDLALAERKGYERDIIYKYRIVNDTFEHALETFEHIIKRELAESFNEI